VRPLGPRERERPRPQVGQQVPPDLALAVAQVAGQPGDALALDDAVGDEAHRPAGHVALEVPGGRAGTAPGMQRLQGPEARSWAAAAVG